MNRAILSTLAAAYLAGFGGYTFGNHPGAQSARPRPRLRVAIRRPHRYAARAASEPVAGHGDRG